MGEKGFVRKKTLSFFKIRYDQNLLNSKISDVQHGLEERLRQWKDHEENLEILLGWLSETEGSLKNYSLRSTLPEKQEQLEKYQVRRVKVFNALS